MNEYKFFPKQITLFMPALAGGGAERVMLHLAKGFADRGYNIDLVVTSFKGVLICEIPENINVVNLDTSRIITSIVPFANYLREVQPDIILSALKSTNVVALIAHMLARSKAKIFVSEHSTFSKAQDNSSKLRERLFPIFFKMLYPKADGIITVSEGVKKDLEEQLGFSDNITTIHNPVVTPELKKKAKESVTHDWFVNPNLKIIIGVGRLIKAKNFSFLIDAFSRVYKKNNNTRLVILGEGPERDALENLVQKYGLADTVWMPGFVVNPYKYMAQSNCFVLSSNWEGLPTVLIEAMACGTPVVSTDCPNGPREILENGKWGKLVPKNDINALCKAILANLNYLNIKANLRGRFFSSEMAVDNYIELMTD